MGKTVRTIHEAIALERCSLEQVKICILKNFNCVTYLDQNHATPLVCAVRLGKVEILKELLSYQEVLNTIDMLDSDRQSALHYACKVGNLEMVKNLLSKGACCRFQDGSGLYPLHHSALKGNIDICRELLNYGAEVDAFSENGSTALHCAVRNGYCPIVTMLLEARADWSILPAQGEWAGRSCIYVAAHNGHLQICQELLRFDTLIIGKEKNRALLVAAERGLRNIVQLLLKNNIDKNAEDKWGETALFKAVCNCHEQIANTLLYSGAEAHQKSSRAEFLGQTVLHISVNSGCVDVFNELMQHDQVCKTVNVTDENGNTALVNAVAVGPVLFSEMLLKSRANPSLKPIGGKYTGKTPLLLAVELGRTDVFNVLMTSKDVIETINLCDKCGQSPLVVSVMNGRPEFSRALLNAGADATLKPLLATHAGKTALLLAAKDGNYSLFKELMGYRQVIHTINAVDRSGCCALHYVVQRSNKSQDVALSLELLSAKCDASIRLADSTHFLKGSTPLDIAAWIGYIEHCKVLVSHGARLTYPGHVLRRAVDNGWFGMCAELLRHPQVTQAINETDGNGQTAVHKAVFRGSTKMAKILLEYGANIKINPKSGPVAEKTVLDLAREHNWSKLIAFFCCGKKSKLVQMMEASAKKIYPIEEKMGKEMNEEVNADEPG